MKRYRRSEWQPLEPISDDYWDGFTCTADGDSSRDSCDASPAVAVVRIGQTEGDYSGHAACERHAGRRLWKDGQR